mmetsp:Transcript_13624/g.49560  ORF Transcript_13624/g.49560 Transcript_13624/m.49560 type:complete len:302 (-) Transcript_13624:1391-2296(-)
MARTRLQQPSPLGAMALGLAILVAAHCQSRGILGVRAAARGNDHGPAEQSLQADAPIISRSELVDWCGRQSEADKDRCRKAPKTCQRFNVTEGGGEDSSAYHVTDLTDLPMDPLFFLHVPRTGGRSFQLCLISQVASKEELCPPAWESIAMNWLDDPRLRKCQYLASHDDFTLVKTLTEGVQRVPTIMTLTRDPVQRLLSTYEWSIENAIVRVFVPPPPDTEPYKQYRGSRDPRKPMYPKPRKRETVKTQDVWPWNYLIELMMDDIAARYAPRKTLWMSPCTVCLFEVGHTPLVSGCVGKV